MENTDAYGWPLNENATTCIKSTVRWPGGNPETGYLDCDAEKPDFGIE